MTSPVPTHTPIARAFARVAVAVCVLTMGGISAIGCADKEENQVLEPSVVGITAQTPPFYQNEEMTLYQVQLPVRLPMRVASEVERNALGKADIPGKKAPFPRMPFLHQRDVDITIRFTLVNLDDQPRTVELLIDPWNEFVRYRPLVQVVNDEESTPDFSGFDKYFVLGPKERFEGTITPDDTKELAIDLATAQNIQANPPSADQGGGNGYFNRAFNLQNRSSAYDPLLAPYISTLPAIPGLVGFDLGLRTMQQSTVAVEVIVDVNDLNGDRVVPPDQTEKTFDIPGTILSPPPPMNK